MLRDLVSKELLKEQDEIDYEILGNVNSGLNILDKELTLNCRQTPKQ